MKVRKVLVGAIGALALTIGAAAPASACPGKYEAQINGLFPSVPVTGKATLKKVGKDWRSQISVKGLNPGQYTYAITINDVPAPGGGGHFTQVDVCKLTVVSTTTAATCENKKFALPAGPIVGTTASTYNFTAWATGSFVKK